MNTQLVVKHNISISSNIEDLKKEIDVINNKYDTIINENGVAETKKVMANLNKTVKAVKAKAREELKGVMLPIEEFNLSIKEIEKSILDVRTRLKDQVEKYEKKTYDEIQVLLESYRDNEAKNADIEPFLIGISDLIKLGSRTKNGALTKQAKEAIDSRINAIENERLKEKIERDRLEKEKEDEIERRANEKAKTILEKADVQENSDTHPNEPELNICTEEKKTLDNSEKTTVKVFAEFIVEVNSDMTKEQVEKAYAKKLSSFSSLHSVSALYVRKRKGN